MKKTGFVFFNQAIRRNISFPRLLKSTISFFPAVAMGVCCGLNSSESQEKKTFADIMFNHEELLELITPSQCRYPFLDEKKRADIFENLLERCEKKFDAEKMKILLEQAIKSGQFGAINAIIRKADYLVSSHVLQEITKNFHTYSYQLIVLYSENKLAKPFQEAFFSEKSGVGVPRVFFDRPGMLEEVQNFLNVISNGDESNVTREIIFHDGNMTCNQTIVSASLQNGCFEFHPAVSSAEHIFCESLIERVVRCNPCALAQSKAGL